jgi:hypothetical protein
MGKALVMANRPELLFGASVTATVGAVLLSAKGGWDARGKVDEANEKRVANSEPPLDMKEKVQLTWLCYMPAAITTIGALGSTTGLHLVHIQEKKALAQAAMVAIEETKQAAKEFERENLGQLSDKEKSAVLDQRSDENGVVKVEDTDGILEELYVVRDAKTGRDIYSNERRIEEAVLHVNELLTKDGDTSLNEFYERAGFELTPDGSDFGWSGGKWIEVQWDTTKRDDGKPVRRFKFRPIPKADFEYGSGKR